VIGVKGKKGKVGPVLLSTEYHAMKAYWGSGSIVPRILDLGTRWEWLDSCSGRFTPRERAPSTHWIGACLGPGAVLDAVAKRNIPSPLPGLEH